MAGRVTLLMAVHCHQPVGNFGFVFEEAYAKAYDPFLRVLERHPGVRLALHYSGCLLDWLARHRPEFIGRVRALVRRGQVEVLASGYYEPILPLIPEADRQGQIATMRAAIRSHFGVEATGLWLTERVWEPDLPATLAKAQIHYTMVDVNQFGLAKPWLPSDLQISDEAFWDLLGSYATDYQGESLVLFPASKRLRYWLPFQPVETTIDFLRRLRREGPVAITFADDGEKFGLWPKTSQWVYDEGWLEHWFTALEREQEWLTTTTFRDYAAAQAPNGRVYLPAGSYEEMLEWSGGHFRNFFTKYPEANAMQQKMLRTSRELRALGAGRSVSPRRARLLREAQRELYTGQCNCAYWHGVFGGLYLSHLRRAVYTHLIAAEELLERAHSSRTCVTRLDADADGREEAALKSPAMSVLVDPGEGGAITEWCLYKSRLNLLDTLTRRPEPYHEKLKARGQQLASSVPGARAPQSIHDVLGVKEAHLDQYLVYDDHRRSAFLDYGLKARPTIQELVRASWTEHQLWSGGPFRWEANAAGRRADGAGVAMVRDLREGGRVRKTLRLAPARSVLECRYELEGIRAPGVALEFNLSLRDERYTTQPVQQERVSRFALAEPGCGVSLTLEIEPAATVMCFPIETVSESEEGLERTYQGLCLMCLWALPETGGPGRWAAAVRWTVG